MKKRKYIDSSLYKKPKNQVYHSRSSKSKSHLLRILLLVIFIPLVLHLVISFSFNFSKDSNQSQTKGKSYFLKKVASNFRAIMDCKNEPDLSSKNCLCGIREPIEREINELQQISETEHGLAYRTVRVKAPKGEYETSYSSLKSFASQNFSICDPPQEASEELSSLLQQLEEAEYKLKELEAKDHSSTLEDSP